MVYTFESYELDEPSFELRRRGALVKLEPKVFDVLRHLVANRDRVVTKTELLAVDGMMVFALYQQGRRDEARELYERLARNDFADFPRDEHWFVLVAESADLASMFDDVRRAERLAALLRPVAHLNVVHDLLRTDLGSASRYLGVCERQLGNLSQAVSCLEAGLAMNERMRAPSHVAWTRLELAETLLARGEAGDPARAVALLGQVHSATRELGLPQLAGRAQALQHRAP